MRNAFLEELLRQARERDDVFLVVGDLGYSVVEPFAEEFPDRFLNAGVAEQNMTGVAAGLASEGFRVFTYSIANFPTLRCLEQIRNDVCYHGLPVTVVAVGGGFAYGALGYSHHGVQDVAVMRAMPGMEVLVPGDATEAEDCVRLVIERGAPSYIRLGKNGEPRLCAASDIACSPTRLHAGDGDGAIVAMGSIAANAVEAAKKLGSGGKTPSVYSCARLAPDDIAYYGFLKDFRWLVSVEEHVPSGGLRDLLAGMLGSRSRLVALTAPAEALRSVGSQEFLRARCGLSVEDIIRAAMVAGAELGGPQSR